MDLRRAWTITCVLALLTACKGGGSEEHGADEGAEPVPIEPGEFTFTLEQSPAGLPLWTTPTARKLQPSDRAPDERRAALSLSAARNEFEAVQLVLGPAAGAVSVEIADFPMLGAEARIELAEVGFQDGWSETLTPFEQGATLELALENGLIG